MRRYYSALYIIGSIVLILVIGMSGRLTLSWRWLLVMATFVGLPALIGRDITGREDVVRLRSGRVETQFVPGRIDGVLIDARNKFSLSRLQLLLWTVVVLSAWITLALHRVTPILLGNVASSDTQLIETIAEVLAGNDSVDKALLRRATAVVEQVMGSEATLTVEENDQTATRLYQALEITIPQEVLLALGISLASLAGAGAIRTNQAAREDGRAQDVAAARTEAAREHANETQAAVTSMERDRSTLEAMSADGLESMSEGAAIDQAAMGEINARLARMEAELRTTRDDADRAARRAAELEAAQQTAIGELHTHPTLADARWSDMVRGDTIANFQFADLGKIQMFFITIALVLAYAMLVWSILSMPQAAQVFHLVPSVRLPEFSQSFVTLLGISHAGYLATKPTIQ